MIFDSQGSNFSADTSSWILSSKIRHLDVVHVLLSLSVRVQCWLVICRARIRSWMLVISLLNSVCRSGNWRRRLLNSFWESCATWLDVVSRLIHVLVNKGVMLGRSHTLARAVVSSTFLMRLDLRHCFQLVRFSRLGFFNGGHGALFLLHKWLLKALKLLR